MCKKVEGYGDVGRGTKQLALYLSVSAAHVGCAQAGKKPQRGATRMQCTCKAKSPGIWVSHRYTYTIFNVQVDVQLPAGRKAYAVDPQGDEEAERKALLRRKHHAQVWVPASFA